MNDNVILNIIFRKPYLKEFLIGYYNNSHPIAPHAGDIIGLILRPLIERKPERSYPLQLQYDIRKLKQQTESCKEKYQKQILIRKLEVQKKLLAEWKNGDFLQVYLPAYYGLRPESVNYLSPDNQRLFESIIYSFFKALFYQSVNIRIETGFSQYDSIMMFAYDFNISFNTTNYDTLKKNYDRYSKEMKNNEKNSKKNVVKMSRVLSETLAVSMIARKSLNYQDIHTSI